jgi:hypothetical protein
VPRASGSRVDLNKPNTPAATESFKSDATAEPKDQFEAMVLYILRASHPESYSTGNSHGDRHGHC